ncbi:TIGR04282 family arsenosugar biosynthesis glycosyltransferase [Mycolicibacterium cosmeticum]|uniref:TIGR04282 family arsenosugar biosynthesis glycosyltransferase n=1 Tax=Mycolicibacterium cosmeticum TaxID=258533 RepID=UPI003204E46A
MRAPCPVNIVVVAKAPVPGLAKTRLAATIGAELAADFAAAALLDTLDAVAATPVSARTVVLTGDLRRASAAAEIRERLQAFTVIGQRGTDFAARLANAHRDASRAGYPVLQIGMDTPQVSAALLAECAQALLGAEAVLGPAEDGGWWALGLSDASEPEWLATVPMSRPDTGAHTLGALRGRGLDVRLLATLADVDTVHDVETVRRQCDPASRFGRAASALEV